jgi:hypothetical protein
MDHKNFLESDLFKKILLATGILIAVFVVFKAGEIVGYRKADFSYRWGNNYYQTFGGPRGEMMRFGRDEFPSPHGVAGKIVKIDLPTFVIAGQDGIEKLVKTDDRTMVRYLRDEMKPADLKADDSVVVIGSPDDKAEINARLIRIIEKK